MFKATKSIPVTSALVFTFQSLKTLYEGLVQENLKISRSSAVSQDKENAEELKTIVDQIGCFLKAKPKLICLYERLAQAGATKDLLDFKVYLNEIEHIKT